jgi:hypothetical protein
MVARIGPGLSQYLQSWPKARDFQHAPAAAPVPAAPAARVRSALPAGPGGTLFQGRPKGAGKPTGLCFLQEKKLTYKIDR